jgi:hypothetical protein
MWTSLALAALQIGTPLAAAPERAPAAQPVPYDLLVFAGGSNMVGVNLGPREPYPGGADHLPSNVFVLDEQDRIAPWHYPLPATWDEAGTAANVTLAYRVLQGWGEQHPERRVLGIFAGRGGSGLNSLQGQPSRSFAGPSSGFYLPGNLFDRLHARISTAIEQGAVLRAFCWQQGESDSGPLDTAGYVQEWLLMWGDLRRTLPPDALADAWPMAQRPALVGGLPPFGAGVYPEIAEGQAAIEQLGTLPQIGYVPSAGLTDFGDGAHFDTASCREFGSRFLQVLQGLDVGPDLPAPLLSAEHAGAFPPGRPLVWSQTLVDASSLLPSYSAGLGPFQALEQYRRPDGYLYFTATWGTGQQAQWRQRSNPLTVPPGVVDDYQLLAGFLPALVGGLSRSGGMSDLFTLTPGLSGPLGLNLGAYYAPDTFTLIDQNLLGLGPNYFLSPTGIPTNSVELRVD